MNQQQNFTAIVGGSVIIALILLAVAYHFFVPRQTITPGSLESIYTTEAPWPAEILHLRARLTALGLPALKSEGTALHIHQHLDIYIHGAKVAVPTDIGVDEGPDSFISSIHTHDTSGIIHVESPTVETFTLGQFFDIWGVRLSKECVGAYCTTDTATLKLYVNGVLYEGDLRALPLAEHQELVLTYGTKEEEPSTIPSSYSFPNGY